MYLVQRFVYAAAAAVACAAAGASAQTATAYDNFGPGFQVDSNGHGMGTFFQSFPRELAQTFVPDVGGTLAKVWVHYGRGHNFVPQVSASVRIATSDPALSGPEEPDVLESWNTGNVVNPTLIEFDSVENPELVAGQTYWIWFVNVPSHGHWNWSPDPNEREDVRKRDIGAPWGPLENLRAGALRIDVIPGASCYPDCDQNTVLDFFDFLCFQNAFLAGDPYADCDQNTVLDFFDFLCFQNEFLAGCP